MGLNLFIEPNAPPCSWEEFCRKKPAFAIALDGYVNEPPRFDIAAPRINFNHHEEVDRLATRSTCAQVLIAIRQGLFDRFQDGGKPKADIYANDCDEDICLSWFLFKNYGLVENALPPAINRLVVIEDLMDATAGAYPLPITLSTLRELAWIFEPYRKFRVSGGLERKDQSEYLGIINDVFSRIDRHMNNAGESIALDIRYKKIGGGSCWSMIQETGSHARTGAYNDGIRAYVSVRKFSEKHWVYTVGKMSPFVSFDITKIIGLLNKAEGNRDDKWGGANTIGGSPRVKGSRLSPEAVEKIINDALG